MNALASLVSQISGGWNTLWAIARPISLSLMWVGSCFLGGPENAAKSCEEVLCFFRFLIASIGFTPTESRMFYLPALKKKGRRVLFHSNESEMSHFTLHTPTLYTSQIEGVQSCVPLLPEWGRTSRPVTVRGEMKVKYTRIVTSQLHLEHFLPVYR